MSSPYRQQCCSVLRPFHRSKHTGDSCGRRSGGDGATLQPVLRRPFRCHHGMLMVDVIVGSLRQTGLGAHADRSLQTQQDTFWKLHMRCVSAVSGSAHPNTELHLNAWHSTAARAMNPASVCMPSTSSQCHPNCKSTQPLDTTCACIAFCTRPCPGNPLCTETAQHSCCQAPACSTCMRPVIEAICTAINGSSCSQGKSSASGALASSHQPPACTRALQGKVHWCQFPVLCSLSTGRSLACAPMNELYQHADIQEFSSGHQAAANSERANASLVPDFRQPKRTTALTLSWWKVSSRKRLSSGVSSTKKAAAFSSRYFSRLVPGMGNTSSPCSAGSLRLNTLALLLGIAQADIYPSQHLDAAHQFGVLVINMVVWASKTAIEQKRHSPVHAPMPAPAGRACSLFCPPASSRCRPASGSSQTPPSGSVARPLSGHSP